MHLFHLKALWYHSSQLFGSTYFGPAHGGYLFIRVSFETIAEQKACSKRWHDKQEEQVEDAERIDGIFEKASAVQMLEKLEQLQSSMKELKGMQESMLEPASLIEVPM